MTLKQQSSLLEVITLISSLLLSASITAASGDITVSGTVNADAFTGDGSGLSNVSVDPVYLKTIIVSPVGTDSENGTALRNALSSISGSNGPSTPYLIKIEPGIYQLGDAGLDMLQYVDVEGPGSTPRP